MDGMCGRCGGVGVAMTLQSFSGFRGAGFGRYEVALGGGWAWGGGVVWVDGTGDELMVELMVYSEREDGEACEIASLGECKRSGARPSPGSPARRKDPSSVASALRTETYK